MRKLALLTFSLLVFLGAFAQDSTSLYQNFDLCDSDANGDHFPPGWSVYSQFGGQIWKCYNEYGVNNSPCLEFNGYQSSSDHIDTSYLLTPHLDLHGYTSIKLYFSAVYLYVGDSLHIKVSNNYSGTGSPEASGVTWTELVHTGVMLDDSNNVSNFRQFSVDLTPYKATPCYVTFEYLSSLTSGSRWSLDSVYTQGHGTVGITNIAEQTVGLTVVGAPVSGQINIGFTATEGLYNLSVYDMVGNKVSDEAIHANEGYQTYSINNRGLASGMYVVKLSNAYASGVTKAIVE